VGVNGIDRAAPGGSGATRARIAAMGHPQPAVPPTIAPLPLPDDPATRDERYDLLATFMDQWMADDHPGEPDWDLEDLERLRLPADTR
jgi:hypothetical protein